MTNDDLPTPAELETVLAEMIEDGLIEPVPGVTRNGQQVYQAAKPRPADEASR